jgi:penicillin-binding protein 2
MAVSEAIPLELKRIRLMLAAMITLLILLAGFLYNLQVARRSEFEQSLQRQSMRRVRLPAVRGRILDRSGASLADNQPCYCLAFYLEEVRKPGSWSNTVNEVMRRMGALTPVVGRKPILTEDDIRVHIRKRLPLPLIAWRNLDAAALARLAETEMDLSGTDIHIESLRVYPHGELGAHVLGFVGGASVSDEEMAEYQYRMPEIEGKSGIERQLNEIMAGEAGGRLVRINASGLKYAEAREREPRTGADVVLSLDGHIQELAEASLRGVSGAVVVLDPSNGDVLAMASSPTFSPGRFVPVLTPQVWDGLNRDPEKPMLNRAVAEIYAPGSIFKPVVALAGLTSGKWQAGMTVNCPGQFTLGGYTLRCWNPNGHGTADLRQAIEQSCNTYFATMGMQCGDRAIEAMAMAMGLGSKTGIPLDREAEGIVPSPEWKEKQWKDKWRFGDTCNLSIGQGALAATPIQMAVVAATLANGGDVFKPRLVMEVRRHGVAITNFPPVKVRRLDVKAGDMEMVRRGMHDVVMAPTGTGGKVRVAGVEMAGKTGTAEYGTRENRKKHGWMIVFAPYEQPQVAVAMVLDDAVSGGGTVAPRLRLLMDGIFNREAAGG